MTALIPPLSIVGPIGDVVPTIAARVRSNLHAADDDVSIDDAVAAAIEYVIDYTDRNLVGLPADSLTMAGIVGFATRIHQDALMPNGQIGGIGDPSFTPDYAPEHLFKHWRHYFLRLYRGWGVA